MSELDEQIENRRAKRQQLAERGIATYPHRFDWDAEPTDIRARHGERTAEELEVEKIHLRVPGRVRAIRTQGKIVFADLSDGRQKLQLFIRLNQLPENARAVLDNLDLGDLVGASGTLLRTRLGELSLAVEDLTLLAKALRPLPEKWHGLADVETRYRQRYLDLATNPESRQVFEVRSAIVKGIRAFLDERGFLEVETPMMHLIPGGAAARPFITHHNALDLDLYLRIAPELFLKRLLVGGIPRVYEINRNFRNEGISTRHNPEFTMLEFYWAYADYQQMMDLTEELVGELAETARRIQGKESLTWEGRPIDFAARPWARLTMRQAVVELGEVEPPVVDSAAALRAELLRRGLPLPPDERYGHLLVALFEAVAEPRLFAPTFITEFPVEISPLAKQRTDDPRFTERFELFLGGVESANGFSELNDPDVQAQRFKEQVALRAKGDAEAHLYDADYVRALEHGMPPAAGIGVGIDRLTMLLTDRQSIRDVILFPLMKPEAEPRG
ncbi:MAG TPA: lysine--tRNA ligase [Thermoanaerobaculia bacterium]|nr:lysine--tRNA ligase [Thermoanaerobaculia bacterium]